jgi:hypothetical protein
VNYFSTAVSPFSDWVTFLQKISALLNIPFRNQPVVHQKMRAQAAAVQPLPILRRIGKDNELGRGGTQERIEENMQVLLAAEELEMVWKNVRYSVQQQRRYPYMSYLKQIA